MREIQVLDRRFREMIPETSIIEKVNEIASRINNDFRNREVIFIGVLNGSFMFASDLFKRIEGDAKITFVKLASYSGTCSTGSIKQLIGWNEDLSEKAVVIIEDIVDSGDTIEHTVNSLKQMNVSDVRIAALLVKPEAYKKPIPLDYIGFEIPNNFVIGYGLDYEGYGRNLPSVYTLII
jgi:hypoxanthine phosphoribosyltransferase